MIPIDVLVEKDERGLFDLAIGSNGDFNTTAGFETALAMSLGEERRADSSEVVRPELRRGWWGNELNDDGFEIGSKLWLLEQARLNQNTANAAVDHAKKGLQWLVEDGHLKDVQASSLFTKNGIELSIKLLRSNSPAESVSYQLWSNTNGL